MIVLDTLAPREFVTLEILSYTALPEFHYVRCKEGQGQELKVELKRIPPPWQKVAYKGIMLVGGLTLLSAAIWGIRAAMAL
jgi:hypothetical protein